MASGLPADQLTFLAEFITGAASTIAATAAGHQLDANPDLVENFEDLRTDTQERIFHLAESIAMDCPALFADHVRWTNAAFRGRGMSTDLLPDNLLALKRAIEEIVPPDLGAVAMQTIEKSRAIAEAGAVEQLSPINQLEQPWLDLARQYYDLAVQGERERAIATVETARSEGRDVSDLIDRVLSPVQAELGLRWHQGEMNVADEHAASMISREVLERFAPEPDSMPPSGRRLLSMSITGDFHDFGINVVTQRFRMAGWRVDALGGNVPPLDFIARALRIKPDAIAISVSLPTLMRATRRLISMLRADDSLQNTLVIVGGRPFTGIEGLWKAVGADLQADTPDDAVERVSQRLQPTK